MTGAVLGGIIAAQRGDAAIEGESTMSIGGRTAWYCPNCGQQLREGGQCQCGSAGVPSNRPLVIEEKDARGGWLRGFIARLTGRGGS